MDERHTGGDDPRETGSAGRANMPPFGRGDETADPRGAGGRPPSHRELDEGSLGGDDAGQERMHGIAAAGSEATDRARELADEAEQRASEAADQAGGRLDEQKHRVAEGLRRGARRVHDTAREHEDDGGVRGMAGRAAHRASHAAEDAADYLEQTQLDELRHRLEDQVRRKPLQTLGLAVAAGWLVGKILR